jgi:hypothetical protein
VSSSDCKSCVYARHHAGSVDERWMIRTTKRSVVTTKITIDFGSFGWRHESQSWRAMTYLSDASVTSSTKTN